jgi:hypothetical protein
VLLVRAQARFIEMTRDRVKAAEASVHSGRFYLAAQRQKSDRKGEGRRARREARDTKKA